MNPIRFIITLLLTLSISIVHGQKVGINIDDPVVELDIRTLSPMDGSEISLGNSDRSHYLGLFSGRSAVPFPILYWMPSDALLFGTFDPDTSISINPLMGILPDGKVGIGTTDPKVMLDVGDIARVGGATWPATGAGLEIAYNDALERGYLQVYNRDSARWGQLYLGEGNVGIRTVNPQYPLDITGNLNVSQKGFFGQVGIGTTDPDAKLEVTDIIRTSGNTWPSSGEGMELAYSTALDLGYIQVYDRDGASWGDLYLGNGNVGIGTTSPLSRLHVQGDENNGSNAVLKVTNVDGIFTHTLLTDGNEIDAISSSLSIQDNSSNHLQLVRGGGSVGLGGQATSLRRLTVYGGRITAGDLANNTATFSVLDTSSGINELVFDGNNIESIDNLLQINRYSAQDISMAIGGGTVGIGGNPSGISRVRIQGTDSDGTNGVLQLVSGSETLVVDGDEMDATGAGADALYLNANSGKPVTINTSTIASGYALNIGGKAIAEEMRVQLIGDWPDYVFEEEYDLPTIKETAAFIEKNKHLPGIPSASEVSDEGILLGEMQTRMMEKIEELTLYIIQLESRIDELESSKNKQ